MPLTQSSGKGQINEKKHNLYEGMYRQKTQLVSEKMLLATGKKKR